MPPPPPPAVEALGCTVNVRPSAPGPSLSDEPPDPVIWNENTVLNVLPAPSGISVLENADPLWPKVAGVTRSTLLVHAALPLTCSVVQSAKLGKLITVAACANDGTAVATSTASAKRVRDIVSSPRAASRHSRRGPQLLRAIFALSGPCRNRARKKGARGRPSSADC